MRRDATVRSDELAKLSHASVACSLGVNDAYDNRPEVHDPPIVGHRFQADDFIRQAEREIPLRLLQRDDAVGIDALELKVIGIFQFR